MSDVNSDIKDVFLNMYFHKLEKMYIVKEIFTFIKRQLRKKVQYIFVLLAAKCVYDFVYNRVIHYLLW